MTCNWSPPSMHDFIPERRLASSTVTSTPRSLPAVGLIPLRARFGPTETKFTYGEDNPYNWGSGFAVATFKHGKLLPPELVQVQDKIAYFRGEPI